MPNSYGRAFTTANFLANLAALKAVNFGSSDPLGTWFVVPNPTTNNIEIWVWEPASILATNEIDVIRPNSVVSNAPGRCLQRLKFDASSLGGILAAIAALNTAGLIERTTTGAAATVPVTTFAKTLLDDIDAATARATIGLNLASNTADATKSVASAAVLTTGRTINGVLFNGSANITINAADTILRIPASEKGTAGGVAPLNLQNQIPAIHLPSYVDDVLEFATLAQFPIAANAESGKIYVDIATSLSYRWSGTIYVALNPSLALGTTSQTAYRGDLGNAAYQHALFTGNPHGTTAANVGLGNVANTAQVDLVSGQTIAGLKTFSTGLRAGAATGNVRLSPGGPSNAGYLEIYSGNGTTRLGFIGFDNTNFNYQSESGALHIFNGGSVRMASTTASTSSTTGALVVGGGVGVAGDINVAGALKSGGLGVFPYETSHIFNVPNNLQGGFLSGDTVIDGTLKGWHFLTSRNSRGGGYGVQIAFCDTEDKIMYRRIVGGTWQAWRNVSIT